MTLLAETTKIEELLELLDEDIRHLETTLSTLDTLRSLIIKRDDSALTRLLDEIRAGVNARTASERRRQELRIELAQLLGCEVPKVTLSQLQVSLPECRRQAVALRQAKLQSLAQQMKREYTLTSTLVSDCARFNRSLMHMFFGLDVKQGLTYNSNGTATRLMDAARVSLQS